MLKQQPTHETRIASYLLNKACKKVVMNIERVAIHLSYTRICIEMFSEPLYAIYKHFTVFKQVWDLEMFVLDVVYF